jgi:hypothetical protein
MQIGLLALAAKPITRGHVELIRLARRENDTVTVFVSTKDRVRPGELPVYAKDMKELWAAMWTHLPGVCVWYVENPVRSIYELVGKESELQSKLPNKYAIYGRLEDVCNNFPDKSLEKYAKYLYDQKAVVRREVSHEETVDTRGEWARAAVLAGNREEFDRLIPEEISNRTWEILSANVENVVPPSPRKVRK